MVTSGMTPRSLIGRFLILAAIMCCLHSITGSFMRFGDQGFYFGSQGFLDNDGEPYYEAVPLHEIGRQFPTYLIASAAIVSLIVTFILWGQRGRALLCLWISIAAQALTLIGLCISWIIYYPLLSEFNVSQMHRLSLELGIGAIAFLLGSLLTFVSIGLRRAQVA